MSIVPDNYIVVFQDNVTQPQIDDYLKRVKDNGGEIKHQYNNVFKGFAAKLDEAHMTSLQRDEHIIKYIEPDATVTIDRVPPTVNGAAPPSA